MLWNDYSLALIIPLVLLLLSSLLHSYPTTTQDVLYSFIISSIIAIYSVGHGGDIFIIIIINIISTIIIFYM